MSTTTIPLATVALSDNSKSAKAYFTLPSWVWVSSAILVLLDVFSANPFLAPLSLGILLAALQLVWRRGEPPVLVFACGMQWLQAASAIFYANYYGLSLEEASGGPEFPAATQLSLWAILVLALGMRTALIGARKSEYEPLQMDALRVDLNRAFVLYLFTFVVASISAVIAWYFLSVAQLIYELIALKWVAVFILAFAALEQKRGYGYVVFCVLLEVSTGLLSYFAAFKSVFFVIVVVALTSPLALKGKRLAITLAVAVGLFCAGTVWSSIKSEYREFVNEGINEQVVRTSAADSAEELLDLVSNLTLENISVGLDAMILRLSYTQYFAIAMTNVPRNMPYENGALWMEALDHAAMPRLFFPNKPVIDDSDRTRLYTGMDVSGAEQGTSIGLGYVAESYIDFGPVLMFAPIFGLGIFYGFIYRLFAIRAKQRILGTGIAVAILVFGAYTIETSNIKLVGWNITGVLCLRHTLSSVGPLNFQLAQEPRPFLSSLQE